MTTPAVPGALGPGSGRPGDPVLSSLVPGPVTAPPGYIVIPPGIAWQGANGATVTTLAPFAPDPLGPPSVSPWYVPFSGFIERLPQQWDDLLRGYTEAAITDAWFAVNYDAQPILATEILADGPEHYWTGSDAAGAKAASDTAQGGNLPLAVTTSKYGGTGTRAFGNSPPTTLLGAQSTTVVNSNFQLTSGAGMWEMTGQNGGTGQQGYCLQAASAGFPPLAQGVTIEFWFQLTSPFPSSFAPQPILLIGTSAGSIWQVHADPGTGHLLLSTPAADFNIGVPGVNYAGTSVMTQVVITFNRTSWDSYVNGQATVIGGTFSPRLPGDFTVLCANGAFTPSITLPGCNGFIGQIAVFPFELPVSRIQTHYLAGIGGMAGEPSQNRIERLLAAGFSTTGRRAIGKQSGIYVTPTVSCQDIPNQPVSQSISNLAADLLPGMLFIAPTGEICHLDRQHSWDQPVKWVLGEEPYAGEFTFEGDIGFDYDVTRIQNQIQLTQLDDQTVTVPSVTAVETASQQQYSTIPNQATGYLQGDAASALNAGPGLTDLANWLANVYRQPQIRLANVTVRAEANPLNWPFVLGVCIGDMIRVNRRPLGPGTPLISVLGRVTQTQRRFTYGAKGAVEASVTCLVDPAPEASALKLGDTTLGTLSGQNCLAW